MADNDLVRFLDEEADALTYPTPHLDKLKTAIDNRKAKNDISILKDSIVAYTEWIERTEALQSNGKRRVEEMVKHLNWYKNQFEVELVMKRGSDFLRRQKGQMKLDSSILEEFLVRLVHPSIFGGLKNFNGLIFGPQEAFMSLAFLPSSFQDLLAKPTVTLKTKDQDFVIGSRIYYRFSSESGFGTSQSTEGHLTLPVIAAECKVNLDKTMFQEAAGTAARLKQGSPFSKYFLLVEFLDMPPEDCRLTAIDNVFLLRHAKRLPFEKRSSFKEVEEQHKHKPIDAEVVWRFIKEIEDLISSKWYDPNEALSRGSFI